MKRIVNGLLYDTDESTLVYMEKSTNRKLYKTANGNWFTFYKNGIIEPKTEDAVKNYLGRVDVDLYIQYFGEVEEA